MWTPPVSPPLDLLPPPLDWTVRCQCPKCFKASGADGASCEPTCDLSRCDMATGICVPKDAPPYPDPPKGTNSNKQKSEEGRRGKGKGGKRERAGGGGGGWGG